MNIFVLKTIPNREDQVMDFMIDYLHKKNLEVYSIIKPHGLRGYILVEAKDHENAELGAAGIPYAKNVIAKHLEYKEIEHMFEQVKVQMNIQKNDIVEIISGPFKREKAKVKKIDEAKEEAVVELLEAAVPIPITVKLDSVKVIRREDEEDKEKKETEE